MSVREPTKYVEYVWLVREFIRLAMDAMWIYRCALSIWIYASFIKTHPRIFFLFFLFFFFMLLFHVNANNSDASYHIHSHTQFVNQKRFILYFGPTTVLFFLFTHRFINGQELHNQTNLGWKMFFLYLISLLFEINKHSIIQNVFAFGKRLCVFFLSSNANTVKTFFSLQPSKYFEWFFFPFFSHNNN